ncbi:hypothetical protein L6164_034339 [Bauhinia variegata]|uniref:Uncharacterized protein n=1 Tax=Bauhinia variegata TaxID=167791 RepID=A0ACB9KUY1_BAUVA|nr:hypothetical protein L6164_034339 [Bauhinia variegata]
MADEEKLAPAQPSPPPQPYFEVDCRSSGKTRRFAVGTDAEFAVLLINRKLNAGSPLALHIEAVKEGEEPIAFGPNSVLVDYGYGWKLQTFTEADLTFGTRSGEDVRPIPIRKPGSGGRLRLERKVSKPVISILYIVKVVFAFILIFVLGAIFTLALENLPTLITFVKSLT